MSPNYALRLRFTPCTLNVCHRSSSRFSVASCPCLLSLLQSSRCRSPEQALTILAEVHYGTGLLGKQWKQTSPETLHNLLLGSSSPQEWKLTRPQTLDSQHKDLRPAATNRTKCTKRASEQRAQEHKTAIFIPATMEKVHALTEHTNLPSNKHTHTHPPNGPQSSTNLHTRPEGSQSGAQK